MSAPVPLPRQAISIKQPWVELILQHRKSIEVRSWSSAFRGPIWLHTGRKPDENAQQMYPADPPAFLGGYVGYVRIVAIEPFTRETWSRYRDRHLVAGPMPPGLFGWELESPVRLRQPVAGPGQVGLFDVPEETVRTLAALL